MIKSHLKEKCFYSYWLYLIAFQCIFLSSTLAQSENLSPYELLEKIELDRAKNPKNVDQFTRESNLVASREILEKLFLPFESVFPELKNSFKVNAGENTDLKKIMDEMIWKIFSSTLSSGVPGFCQVIPENGKLLMEQLGISDQDLADKIFSLCLSRGGVRSLYGVKLFSKNYVFVKTLNETFRFSGWTNDMNTTYFFVTRKTSWGDLIDHFVHELAMSYDSKLFMLASRFYLKEISIGHMKCHNIENGICRIPNEYLESSNSLFRRAVIPEIAYTFATMRADEVVKRIHWDFASQFIPRQDLRVEFRRIINFYRSNNKKDFIGNYNPLTFSNIFVIAVKKMYLDLDEAIEYVLNPKNMLKSVDGSDLDFVNYMSYPDFARTSLETFGNGGPGCGYCGGSIISDKSKENKWNDYWKSVLLGK